MKQLSCLVFALFICSLAAWAVPATPSPITYTLPDGSQIEVRLCGDEFGSWYSDLNGSALMKDEHGYLVPASADFMEQTKAVREANIARAANIVSTASSLAPSGMSKAQAAARTSHVPSSGHVRIPVVLVNYTDCAFTMDDPVGKFDSFYNSNGGTNPNTTGSVHTYYVASSDSTLFLDFDVLGPFTLSREMAYYGGHSGSYSDVRPDYLVKEAAQLAYNAGIDMSVYDNNNDGYVDNLSVVTAGYNEAEGGPDNSIWPHYSMINPVLVGSVKVCAYLIISEYKGKTGTTQAGIGTYCHEFGHALGLPDFYNTASSDTYTIGSWAIMCSGSYNNNGCTPPTYTAFERFTMGWLVPEQLQESRSYQLEPIETSNKAYLIARSEHNLQGTQPSPSEYFLLENRQRVGWDAKASDALAGTGLMISHITWNDTKWTRNTFNNATPLGFDVVEAVQKNPSDTKESDLFPGPGKITSYVPEMNDGELLHGSQIQNIMQMSDGRISFRFGEQTDEGFLFTPVSSSVLTTTVDNGVKTAIDTLNVHVSGKKLRSDSVKVYIASSNFSFSPDAGQTWYQGSAYDYQIYADAVAADSTYSRDFLVIGTPQRQNCDTLRGNMVVMTSDEMDINQLMVYTTAPRPTYIDVPTALSETQQSATSFTAVWEEQEDAEYYYLTLYTIDETESEMVQDFEAFATASDREMIGWTADGIKMFTATVSSGKYAIQLAENGAYLLSETYPSAAKYVSLWVSNNYVSDATGAAPGGEVLIEGSADGDTWSQVGSFKVTRTNKGVEKYFELDEAAGITRFRLTYTHTSGTGGTIIDDFTVGMSKRYQYVYKANDYELNAPTNSAIFRNLTEGQTYYWQVQASEEKGCKPNYSKLSAPRSITLTGGSSANKRKELQVRRSDDGEYVLIMSVPADGATKVNIYTADGRLVGSVLPESGAVQVSLPSEGLMANTVYYVKLVGDKMKRKADYAKFLYY